MLYCRALDTVRSDNLTLEECRTGRLSRHWYLFFEAIPINLFCSTLLCDCDLTLPDVARAVVTELKVYWHQFFIEIFSSRARVLVSSGRHLVWGMRSRAMTLCKYFQSEFLLPVPILSKNIQVVSWSMLHCLTRATISLLSRVQSCTLLWGEGVRTWRYDWSTTAARTRMARYLQSYNWWNEGN